MMNAYIFSNYHPTNPIVIDEDVYAKTSDNGADNIVIVDTVFGAATAEIYAPTNGTCEVIYGPVAKREELPEIDLLTTFATFDVISDTGCWYQVRRMDW